MIAVAAVMLLSKILNGFEMPDIEIGIDNWYNQTDIQAKYLTNWKNSIYFDSGITTNYHFNTYLFSGIFVRTEYHNFNCEYRYYFFEKNFHTEWFLWVGGQDKTGYRSQDGSVIHPIEIHSRIHNFSVDYQTNISFKPVFCLFHNIYEVAPSSVYDYGISPGEEFLSFKEKVNMIGLGIQHEMNPIKKFLSLSTKIVYFPFTGITFFYRNSSENISNKKLNGSGISVELKLSIIFKRLTFSGGYKYSSIQDRKKLLKINTKGSTFEIHYLF